MFLNNYQRRSCFTYSGAQTRFVGYTTPISSVAIDMASFIEYKSENNITLSELVCIGCDGLS